MTGDVGAAPQAHGPSRAVLLGAGAAVVLLLLAAPSPAECLRILAGAARASEPGAPLIALLAVIAWALAAWLACTVLLTAGGQLPGRTGRALRSAARRTAPAALRRSVEIAFGLTVVAGGLASPAAASVHGEVAITGAPTASLDWAAPAPAPAAADASAQEAAPDLDWSGTSAPATASAVPAPAAVVVRPGDTLWGLAEQDLRIRSGVAAEPTAAEVAAAWPAWWAANREAVGDDPHLIRPGTPLTPPSGTAAPVDD